MLISRLKSRETIDALIQGKKVFIINCHGCREVYFPYDEAVKNEREWTDAGKVTGSLTTDYICNSENLTLSLKAHKEQIESADAIVVFSCGVGVQTVASQYEGKKVYSCCDTYPLPGFQGVTPLEYQCDRCGECWLNLTGGICPITACSKSLVNGPCGGAKDGRCEVDPDMECGWGRIYRKLRELGRLDALKCPPRLHNFATEQL